MQDDHPTSEQILQEQQVGGEQPTRGPKGTDGDPPKPEKPPDVDPPREAPKTSGPEEAEPPEPPRKRVEGFVEETKKNWRGVTDERMEWLRANVGFYETSSIGQINIYQSYQGEHLYNAELGVKPARAMRIDPDDFVRLREVFVQPRPYPAALNFVREYRWVILRGRPRIGKRTAAIYLALDLFPNDLDLIELSPEEDLKKWIASEQASERRIYLIDGLVAAQARELRDFDRTSLKKILTAKNSYLIICASQEVKFAADLSNELIQSWASPNEPRMVVDKHLMHYGVADEEVRNTLLNHREVETHFRELPPAKADLLARQLSRCHIQGLSIEEALRGFTLYSDDALRDDFGTAEDEERAFRIAVAVFSGLPFTILEETAQELAKLLAPAGDSSTNGGTAALLKTRSLFDDTSEDRIRRARAETVYDFLSGTSLAKVELVQLKDPAYRAALLSYVWRKYGSVRSILLQWLSSYGDSLPNALRLRAAAAAAFLARFDFEAVVRQVFSVWAYADTRLHRSSLSYAFGSLLLSEQQTDATLGLLRRWAQSNRMELVWAASRAYSVVGHHYPREAMEQWRNILTGYNFLKHIRITQTNAQVDVQVDQRLERFIPSIFDAISSFFVSALSLTRKEFVHVYTQIVASLRGWIDLEEAYDFSLYIAFPLFISLMHLPIAEDEATEEGENGVVQAPKYAPVLLVLANHYEEGDTCLQDLGWLLSKAIQTPETRDVTIDGGLHFWLQYVAEDENLYQALKGILRALVKEPSFNRSYWHRMIGRPFENWANYSRNPLTVAGRLVRELGVQRR